MWSRQTAPLAALAALCFACGDGERPALLADAPVSSIPGCEDFGYEPCDILAADCQDEVFGLMACARNEDRGALRIPPVLLMTEAEAVALVEAAAADSGGAAPDETFAAELRGLEMLGLVEAGLIENEADIVSVTIEAVVAFYLIPTREIVIIDRGEALDDLEANATLAHELVHAMQDARHGLAQFTGAHSRSSDAALAAASVIEGEATFYQLLLMFSYDGVDLDSIDYRTTLDNLADIGTGMTLDAGSPMITANAIFPYTHGARYAGAHWLRGQEPAVDALYVTPPSTSLEVMSGGWRNEPFDVASFETPPEPLPGHAALSADVAGAWVVFGLLGALSLPAEDPESFEELASHWRGDRLWTFQDDEGRVAALWAIAWDGESAAARGADHLARWAPEGAAADVSVEGNVVRIAVVENGADLGAWVERLRAAAPQ